MWIILQVVVKHLVVLLITIKIKDMIKFFIKLFFGKAIQERKKIRKHNANVLQSLLNTEHEIRDAYNDAHNTVYTTAKALDCSLVARFCPYNRHNALKEADFR